METAHRAKRIERHAASIRAHFKMTREFKRDLLGDAAAIAKREEIE